jgi:primosomal protein N' (replication factor Y)
VAVERLDRDVAARAGAQKRILKSWHEGTIDVLVGTQMVSKGHDVPGVTLVAVVLADQSLNVPDFRAAERTFQLLVQVAGRAGRGDRPAASSCRRSGRRTRAWRRPRTTTMPASWPASSSAGGRSAIRRSRGSSWCASTARPRPPSKGGRGARRALREHAVRLGLGASAVLGPAPPPVERVRGRHRRQLLLRHGDVPGLRALARAARPATQMRTRRRADRR